MKKLNKNLSILLLVISLITFSSYPLSRAKYMSSSETPLTYKMSIKKLADTLKITNGTTTNEISQSFVTNFDIGKNIIDGDKADKYTVDLGVCVLDNTNAPNYKLENKKIVFSYTSTVSNKNVVINFHCPKTDENYEQEIKVSESITNSKDIKEEFTYLTGKVTVNKKEASSYLKEKKVEGKGTGVYYCDLTDVADENKVGIFKDCVSEYKSILGISTTNKYIDNYLDITNINDVTTINKDGVTIGENDDAGKIYFEVMLPSIAHTFYKYGGSSVSESDYHMVFYDNINTKEKYYDLWEYYLDKYYSLNTEDALNYFKDNDLYENKDKGIFGVRNYTSSDGHLYYTVSSTILDSDVPPSLMVISHSHIRETEELADSEDEVLDEVRSLLISVLRANYGGSTYPDLGGTEKAKLIYNNSEVIADLRNITSDFRKNIVIDNFIVTVYSDMDAGNNYIQIYQIKKRALNEYTFLNPTENEIRSVLEAYKNKVGEPSTLPDIDTILSTKTNVTENNIEFIFDGDNVTIRFSSEEVTTVELNEENNNSIIPPSSSNSIDFSDLNLEDNN